MSRLLAFLQFDFTLIFNNFAELRAAAEKWDRIVSAEKLAVAATPLLTFGAIWNDEYIFPFQESCFLYKEVLLLAMMSSFESVSWKEEVAPLK